MSTLPSPLKSATATAAGVSPVGNDLLRLERAVAVAKQHAHGVVASVGGDDVGNTVAVQVGHRQGE